MGTSKAKGDVEEAELQGQRVWASMESKVAKESRGAAVALCQFVEVSHGLSNGALSLKLVGVWLAVTSAAGVAA